MENVKIEIFADTCKKRIRDAIIAGLHEGCGEVLSQVIRNTRVDTGHLKNSWQLIVDEDKLEAYIGSPLENAIWEEFGTGEHALEGNGRKDWKGKRPSRALHRAFIAKKPVAQRAVERQLKNLK